MITAPSTLTSPSLVTCPSAALTITLGCETVIRPWMLPPCPSIMPLVSAPNGSTVSSLAAQTDSASSPRACSALITRG
eukprot:2619677-Prymnesium_polylepis.1